jgi:hypothetical protein
MFVRGKTGYRCRDITILKENQTTTFQCLSRIEPCEGNKQCYVDFAADGEVEFEVSVKTADEDEATYNNIVYVELIGTDGDSGWKILDEGGFTKGSVVTGTINISNIGPITGYRLKLDAPGKWKPTLLSVKNSCKRSFNQFSL